MSQPATRARGPFKPTPDMIAAAETLLLAIVYEQSVREVVEAYQRKVLSERRWEVDPTMRVAAGEVEYVTDIKRAWLMKDDDFAVYHRRCNEERIAAKLKSAIDESRSQDDCCPLLVAEDTTRKARFALCDAMAGITKIDGAKAVTMRPADYDELVDITLRLLGPFVKNVLATPHAA